MRYHKHQTTLIEFRPRYSEHKKGMENHLLTYKAKVYQVLRFHQDAVDDPSVCVRRYREQFGNFSTESTIKRWRRFFISEGEFSLSHIAKTISIARESAARGVFAR